jgi:hypothetical protein
MRRGCKEEKKFAAGKEKGKRGGREEREDSMRSQVGRWHAYEKGATKAKFPPQFNDIIAL